MILWNNIDLRQKGIIVEKTPKMIKGKRRIETYDIEGRNGVLMVDKGTYESFVCSLECHFDTDNFSLDSIKEFLDGYGKISFDGLREYEAIVQNKIEFDKVQNFKKFQIQFLVNPIAHDIEYTESDITSNITELYIEQTYNTYPYIEIQADGDVSITFNNKTFYLYDLNPDLVYTLDCENKIIINSNGLNCSNQMKYDFPYLQKNNNVISYNGNINYFKLMYKKAYL